MAGKYQDNGSKSRVAVVEHWLLANVQNPNYRKFDDLHIDQIDEAWRSPARWIEGGLEAFQLATKLRSMRNLECTVALAYSLISGEKARGVDFSNPDELLAELNWSPPSLYAFGRGEEPWSQTELQDSKSVTSDITTERVDTGFFGYVPGLVECLYMEFRQTDVEEYSRTFFLIG